MGAGMDTKEDSLRLAESGIYLFFRVGKHFQDPMVPEELARLRETGVLADYGVVGVVGRLLKSIEELVRGIYAPVPIARGLEQGDEWQDLLVRFRYAMIVIDDHQEWSWLGRPVAPRIRAFFSENIGWQPAIGRHFVEYRVSDEWFDKCYFDGAMTPLLATAFEADGRDLLVTLSCGRRPLVDLSGVRLDERERLFVQTHDLGEALCSDGLRFQVLKTVADDLRSVNIAGRDLPLIGGEST